MKAPKGSAVFGQAVRIRLHICDPLHLFRLCFRSIHHVSSIKLQAPSCANAALQNPAMEADFSRPQTSAGLFMYRKPTLIRDPPESSEVMNRHLAG